MALYWGSSMAVHKMKLEVENPMAESQFVYVTYIRTTPEKLWRALIEPEFTRRYWMATTQESEWKPGASWRIVFADGRMADSGEVGRDQSAAQSWS